MPASTIVIVSAIASAFLLFGGVLAWGDFYTRHTRRGWILAPEPTADAVATKATPDAAERMASKHRKAA